LPFLISPAPQSGCGYLALVVDGPAIVGLEASFGFGGVSAFAFEPMAGIGGLTSGIFLRAPRAPM
jgi:hypothetical protein